MSQSFELRLCKLATSVSTPCVRWSRRYWRSSQWQLWKCLKQSRAPQKQNKTNIRKRVQQAKEEKGDEEREGERKRVQPPFPSVRAAEIGMAQSHLNQSKSANSQQKEERCCPKSSWSLKPQVDCHPQVESWQKGYTNQCVSCPWSYSFCLQAAHKCCYSAGAAYMKPSYESHFEGLSNLSPSIEMLVQIQDVNPRI